jgi:hypothetical protein
MVQSAVNGLTPAGISVASATSISSRGSPAVHSGTLKLMTASVLAVPSESSDRCASM